MTAELRDRVDDVLDRFLDHTDRRNELPGDAEVPLVDEVRRLLRAGGKRLRPTFCYWGFRAAGGADHGAPDAPIVRAAAALELLHTMALVHDDLIDGAKERRGAPTTAARFAERADELGARGDPEWFGRAIAVLVGDLAAVLADRLFISSGFPPDELVRGLAVYHPMREAMAAGQYRQLAGERPRDAEAARRAAALKGGGYTVDGPVRIGAAFAGAADAVDRCLSRFGAPLGEAFQLRDDLEDGDADPGVTRETVAELVADAKRALDPAVLDEGAILPLTDLADRVAT
ncbi:MAG TPA: polyprenyl synthetase family protein [Actinomycetota bacterium]|nr:polyprenyl synthetase family protein [Actinomycetota bacterium]